MANPPPLSPTLCLVGEPGSGRTQALIAEGHRRRLSEPLLRETILLVTADSARARPLRAQWTQEPEDSLRVMSAHQWAHQLLQSFQCVTGEVLTDWLNNEPDNGLVQTSGRVHPLHFIDQTLLFWLAERLLHPQLGMVLNAGQVKVLVEAWLEDGPGSADHAGLAAGLTALIPANAPAGSVSADTVAAVLTQGTLGQALLPQAWIWPATLAVVNRLIADHPEAVGQLRHQFQCLLVDDLPDWPAPAQLALHRLAEAGLPLVVTGDPAGIDYWLNGPDPASTVLARTLETLPRIAADPAQTRLPSRLSGLSDWLGSWQDPAHPTSLSPPEPLDWLTLREFNTLDDEVEAVLGQLSHWAREHPASEPVTPVWALVVPSTYWKAQWIDALSLAGGRDPGVALSLTLQSRLLAAAKSWLDLLVNVMSTTDPAQPPTTHTIAETLDSVLTLPTFSQCPPSTLTSLTLAALTSIRQNTAPDHWLADLLRGWWQAQDQPVTADFWQAMERAVLHPVRQTLPIADRLTDATTTAKPAESLSLFLSKLVAQPDPLASDAGLPCRVLPLDQARTVWVERLLCVSLMEQLANPFDQLLNGEPSPVSAETAPRLREDRLSHQNGEGRDILTGQRLRQALPEILGRAGQSVWLSTHRAETSTGWTPSAVVEELADAATTLTGEPFPLKEVTNPLPPIELRVNFGTRSLSPENTLTSPPDPFLLWNDLDPAPAATVPLWPAAEVLPLSPTGIEAYMRCPRQFYYKQLLRLPDDEVVTPSPALLIGQLVHKLLELFNRQVAPDTHTVAHLLAFVEPLLDIPRHRHEPPPAAWADSRIYQQYRRLSPLEQDDLTRRIMAALTDLGGPGNGLEGYFDTPMVRVVPEVSLRQVRLPEWPEVVLTVTADALLQRPDGRWDLVDYKTYGPSAFATAPDKNAEKLATVLAPLDLDAPTHAERFDKQELQGKKRLVQLPLYYFAFEGIKVSAANSDTAQSDKPALESLTIRRLVLQIVRTPQEGNAKTGSVAVELSVESVREGRPDWLADFRVAVVDPVRQAVRFDPSPEPAQCSQCAYSWICEGAAASDGEDDPTEAD